MRFPAPSSSSPSRTFLADLERSDQVELATTTCSIRLRLELERFVIERSNQRLVIGGDDDDARVGDGVAPSILLFVVADQGAARHEHVAVDDGALDPGMPADPHPRHQNALV